MLLVGAGFLTDEPAPFEDAPDAGNNPLLVGAGFLTQDTDYYDFIPIDSNNPLLVGAGFLTDVVSNQSIEVVYR